MLTPFLFRHERRFPVGEYDLSPAVVALSLSAPSVTF